MSSALQEKSSSCSRIRSSLERKALGCVLAALILLSLVALNEALSGIGLTVLPVNSFLLSAFIPACAVYPIWYCYYLTTDDGKVYRCFVNSLKSANIICNHWYGATLPDVIVKNGTITVSLDNFFVRKKLETYIDQLSSAVPAGFIISETSLSYDESKLLCKYVRSGESERIYYRSAKDVVSYVSAHPYEFPLDRYHAIDLYHTPHLLITGKTGSGKSYYAMLLTAISLLHKWYVYILDYKQSYTIFSPYCHAVYTVDDIYRELKAVQQILHERKAMMATYTAIDPNAVAVDIGFVPVVVVIEEYMALMHSGADKKQLKEIESMIMEITAMGRALSIHLILIMQVSAAKDLDSSIRSNLAPLVFGSANRTIYETAFSTKDIPKIGIKMKSGEGLGLDEVDVYRFKAPTLEFPLTDLLQEIHREDQC